MVKKNIQLFPPTPPQGCHIGTHHGNSSHMTQEGDQSLGGAMLWLESRAVGLLHSSWDSHCLTSKALRTIEEDVLFNNATALFRLTSVSSTPFTFNKMSPGGQRSRSHPQCNRTFSYSAKEQGLTDGCGEVVRVGHISASCIDMKLNSHVENGELCAFCKALVSRVQRFLKHTHWCSALVIKKQKTKRRNSLIYHLIKENLHFSLLFCFMFLAQRKSTWQKLSAPAQSQTYDRLLIHMISMNKELSLRVSGMGSTAVKKNGPQNCFLKEVERRINISIDCTGAKNQHWLSTYCVLDHFHTYPLICSCFLTNHFLVGLIILHPGAWIKVKSKRN